MIATLPGILTDRAMSAPDREMLIGPGTDGARASRTWGQQYERSRRLCTWLTEAGVRAGDRVAFLDANGLAFFDVLFACGYLQATMVPLNWRLSSAEIAAVLNDADVTLTLSSTEFAHLLPAAEYLIDAPDGGGLETWIGEADPADATPPPAAATALLVYTSGTTGTPKGVMITHENMWVPLAEYPDELGTTSESVSMAATPLFHIGGLVWAAGGFSTGCRTVIVRDTSSSNLFATIEAEKVTQTFLVPTQLRTMIDSDPQRSVDLSSLKIILYGAATISPSLLEESLEHFGCSFAQMYGMTEAAGTLTVLGTSDHNTAAAHPERLKSCGRPMRQVEIKVVDPLDGHEVLPREVGEILVRSPQIMKGYFRREEATSEAIDENGYLHTGDAGWFDAAGYLYLADRLKDMIISGGENIYPAEVEHALLSHPQVADVAVIGVPHAKWGESICAVVVACDPTVTPNEQALIGYCRENIAHYKCPTRVEYVDTLPRNASGKVLKHVLREAHQHPVSN